MQRIHGPPVLTDQWREIGCALPVQPDERFIQAHQRIERGQPDAATQALATEFKPRQVLIERMHECTGHVIHTRALLPPGQGGAASLL